MDYFRQLLLVMLGGAIGSGVRFSLSFGYVRHFGLAESTVPTLIVNVAGSFAITFIAHLAAAGMFSPNLNLFLTAGVMGGMTTYSAFNHAVVEAVRRGEYAGAALNASATFALCLAAGLAGMALAGKLTERPL